MRDQSYSAVLALCTLALGSGEPARSQARAGDRAQAPVVITLPEAIRRAETSEPNFAAARAQQRSAALDRSISRASLLPGVAYNNNVLYTQPNGLHGAGQVLIQPPVVFIANNSVHEYTSQASVTENLSLGQLANVRLADASAARAGAELEVSRRGLVAATAGLFYGVIANERRLTVLEAARDEAAKFVSLTEEREAAREAAHADVLKADLTLQQRARDLENGVLARDRARLELAVLLFADPLTPFTVQAPEEPPALPTLADVQAAAGRGNPELTAALAALRQSDAEVLGAEASYLPAANLNFAYGIDAAQFARYAPRTAATLGQAPLNLGYSISATLNIPVWDWLATEHRVKQSEVRRDAARVALAAAQRRLIADLQESYSEAQLAQAQLASLEATVRTAGESLRLTELRYESGEALVLEVVDAQTALYNAETAQEDGQVRYQQALSALQTLTGTL